MICHCGKPVWEYDPATWTCKTGHHTPIAGVTVERIAPPVSSRFTLGPRVVAVIAGAGTSLALFVIEHIF